jgi:glycerol-3-phosphate dehydrogenase
VAQVAQEGDLPVETVAHLNTLYGSRLYQVLEMSRNDVRGKQAICPHSRDILSQIWHATQVEGALTVSDFLLRRSAIGLASCQGLDAVETVAQEMGHLLGWSVAEQRRQIEAYRSSVALSQRFRVGATES